MIIRFFENPRERITFETFCPQREIPSFARPDRKSSAGKAGHQHRESWIISDTRLRFLGPPPVQGARANLNGGSVHDPHTPRLARPKIEGVRLIVRFWNSLGQRVVHERRGGRHEGHGNRTLHQANGCVSAEC
eukprot:scaffold346_cov347-Pavlova_lutheri.AAC.35